MALDGLKVDLSIVLGKTRMPLGRALRLVRGAAVRFDGEVDDLVEILANGHPVARGRVTVADGTVRVEVAELVRKPEANRAPGSTIGGHRDALEVA